MTATKGSDSDVQRSETGGGHEKPKSPRFSKFQGRDRWVFLAMVGIPAAIHILVVWIPTLLSIVLSFTRWRGAKLRFGTDGPNDEGDYIEAVGVDNYDTVLFGAFSDDTIQALLNNLWLLLFLFIGPTALGMFLAYLLDKELKGTRFYQSLFYTPVVLSLAVVGYIWQNIIYNPEDGLATYLFGSRLDDGTIDSIDWLGNQEFIFSLGGFGLSKNFLAVLVAMAWRHSGYIMVLYLAGLKSVDPSLRESASLDGCNEWQSFRHVLFPTLRPINVIVVVITVIEALRAYDIVKVLDEPRRTEMLSHLTTNALVGEGADNIGRGSAYATLLFILCIGFVLWYVTNHYRNQEEAA